MGTMPSTSNGTAQTVDQIISFSMFKLAVPIGLTVLYEQFPFLAWPILHNIVEYAVDKILSPLYVALSVLFTFSIIDLQTLRESDAYGQAEAKLRAVHLSGDQNAIKSASDEFDKTLASLIHWDGSVIRSH